MVELLTTADRIRAECSRLADMLCEKNERYGDSAINPVRIFSRADPLEALWVRLDDKLSRVKRGEGVTLELLMDTAGYLILAMVRVRKEVQEIPPPARPPDTSATETS